MATTGRSNEARAAAFERFNALMWGLAGTQCLYIVAKLRVADALAGGPRPVAEVAREVGADPDALERIVRALVAMGVFTQPEPGVAGLTDVGELLVEGPGSTRHNAIFFGDLTYRTWSGALTSAISGRPAFDEAFGAPFFDYLGEHPDEAETFNRAMEGGSAARIPPLLERDWQGVGTVVDVGGGNGAVLRALLEANGHLRGVVFDLPNVAASAQRDIGEAGLGERCAAVGGSFFDEAPPGGDVYLLAQILHDWSDDDAARILTRVREAMRDDAVLLVLELIVPEDDRPHPSKLVDLQMLVLLGGRERTRTQWAELLRRGGFELAAVTDGARASVIEARPV
jgi:hypothetical protein